VVPKKKKLAQLTSGDVKGKTGIQRSCDNAQKNPSTDATVGDAKKSTKHSKKKKQEVA